MIQYGFIDSVSLVKAGGSLIEDVTAGDTVLLIDDAVDFSENGGSVDINGTVYSYTTADLDSEQNSITLSTALIEDVEAGHPVYVTPDASEKRAYVILADNGDTLDVRVPHNLYDRVAEGIRDTSAQEAVTVDLIGNEWVITDIIGKQPVIDGSYLDPTTVPPAATDGLPPTASPVPVAIGSISVIVVRWSGVTNADPVTYSLHMSTTPGFTVDSTTLLNVTPGLSTTVRALPDNSPLAYGVDYYFRVVASDADGDAAPSSDVSEQLFQVNSPDIAANYVYAGQIIADQITGGTVSSDLTLSSTIKTGDTGAYVQMSPSGLLITDSTGSPTTQLGTDGQNYFKGNVEASGLTVTGGATLRSTTNELSRAAVVTLQAGITASTNQPTVVVDWEKVLLKEGTGLVWPTPGNLKGLSRTPDGKWMSADTTGAFHKWNSDGSWVSSTNAPVGLTHVTQPVSGGPYFGAVINGATFSVYRLTEDVVFTDDFSGTLSNWPTLLTSGSGSIAISSGKVVHTEPGAVSTTYMERPLEGSFRTRGVSMNVAVTAGNPDAVSMAVGSYSEQTEFSFAISLGKLNIAWLLNGVSGSVQITYSSTQHAYWRIYELNGRINFQTSPDGATWTTQQSVAHGRPASVFSNFYWNLQAQGVSTGSVIVTADNARYCGVVGGLPTARINTAQNPALGSYSGDLLVAEFDDANNRFKVNRISTADMSTLVTTFTGASNAAFSGTLAGVLRANFDFPEERYVFSVQGGAGTNWWSFKNSDGTYQSADNFPVITGGHQGMGYDGTNFWALGSDANLYKHTNLKWVSGTDSASWQVGFSWYDGGSHETTPSPYANITMKMRARLTVTSSAIPYTAFGDPDRIRIYIGRGSGTKYLQTTTAANINTATLTTATFSGTAAPTTNTFTSAAPAKIRNSDDSLIISADGTITLSGKQVSAGPPTVTVLQTTGTWTKPAGLKWAYVEVIGSGGGGGGPTGGTGTQSEGGHGGGGGYTKKFYLASDLSATEAYTVGAAGTGGVAAGTGVTGGTVTFKGLSATGGAGGVGMPAVGATSDNVASGGIGGVGSGGDVNLPGENGGKGRVLQGKAVLTGRAGSSGGGMGAGGFPPTSVGTGGAGSGYGGGGAGGFGSVNGFNGGAGSKGAVIITCYF